MRFPLLSKAVAMAAVIVVLAVALFRVESVVYERQMRQREAEANLQESLASPQTVLGPLLQMRCTETWERADGDGRDRKTVTERRERVLTAWPRTLVAQAEAAIEPRYRGLFKLNGYLAKGTVSARFDALPAPAPSADQPGARMLCEPPTLAVALTDARGIRSASVLAAGETRVVQPGSLLKTQPQGFHVTLPPAAVEAPLDVKVALELAGTRSIGWVPVGQETTVALTSPWPHPSFSGRFLPVERKVSAEGFSSRWQVSALATTAQAAVEHGGALCEWRDDGVAYAVASAPGNGERTATPCVDSFSVGFIDPVNGYVLNDRAVKYGMLFIVLTFVTVALVEVMRRLRVHPIQYLLVGFALTVFFLLLLSLSEHLPFWQAYLAASVACTALLAFYGAHLLGGARAGLAFGAGLGLLYAALYALLQMEQTALVLGSLLLFAVLAGVMVATRRINWYTLMAQLRSEGRAAA
ncbi:cell envelope integrity protein CreD [Ideonella sp. BN130291]|uniref:cell envelope integrity protein CreD n=1 Tax=Ideonella sp. BN130291 TaxID=3112940 RepID=UPI002E26F171|nr:cell envelope integrity protein CreD [Ideonella sp. BN130291]